MDKIVSNFTGTEGRIGRQQWWIGIIVVAVATLVIGWVLGLIVGPDWGRLISAVVIAYPQIAIGVKRRHDKDNAGLDVIVFIALGLIINLLAAVGVIQMAPMGTGAALAMSPLSMVVMAIFGVYALYILVVLGFLKGTTGPNQYGADPLGGGA